jgi:L-lactate utilization protein LutC
VRAGNRPGIAPSPEERGTIGYQGAGPDPVARFTAECTAAGGQVHVVSDPAAAIARTIELVQTKSIRKALVGRGAFLDTLDLPAHLHSLGIQVDRVDTLGSQTSRDPFFTADAGISGVDYLIAETGTAVLKAGSAEPRSLSLLPPIHIAIAERGQILPDLFDLFGKASRERPPSCLTLITGPSKTGDIELRLVTGVHGPGEVHVILVE